MSETAAEDKASMRSAATTRRDVLSTDLRLAAAETIAARVFPLSIGSGTLVSGFMPLHSEINPLPLMRRLSSEGARLALPVVAGRGKPLIMRAWSFDAPLGRGQWGIREPLPEAAEVEPDILLVPLLAFDRSGQRLGYGAGYYDMTITSLRMRRPVIAVGLAYAAQEVPRVPATSRDAPLDLVLTEREVIDLRDK